MMNKKEKAELAEAKRQVFLARAFCWPTEPEPKPMTYEQIKRARLCVVRGWFMHTWGDTFNVTEGCSSGIYHCSDSIDKTTTQGMGRMYATEAEAWLAARWELCRRFAETLARLDQQKTKSHENKTANS